MANVSVLNTTNQLSGKTIAVCENDQTITGAWTFSGNQSFTGNVTLGNAVGDTLTVTATITSNLLFTDATYDIGASGATRPRDFFLSRNATIGGTLGVTGVATFTAVPITTTGLVIGAVDTSSIRLDLETGTLAVREGDDSAYAPIKALTVEATDDITVGGGDIICAANTTIRRNTSDTSDSGEIEIAGGGATWGTGSRGASFKLRGNEHATNAGYADVLLGDVAGAVFRVIGPSGGGTAHLSITGSNGLTTSTGDHNDYQLKVNNGNANPSGVDVRYTGAAPNGTGNLFLRGSDTGGNRFELRSNGGLANYSANDVNLSDERKKNILGSVESQWDRWKALDFLHYAYKDSPDQPHIGLTAQRTRRVFPELITAFEADFLGIRESELFMVMGRVVQELQNRVEKLEAN